MAIPLSALEIVDRGLVPNPLEWDGDARSCHAMCERVAAYAVGRGRYEAAGILLAWANAMCVYGGSLATAETIDVMADRFGGEVVFPLATALARYAVRFDCSTVVRMLYNRYGADVPANTKTCGMRGMQTLEQMGYAMTERDTMRKKGGVLTG